MLETQKRLEGALKAWASWEDVVGEAPKKPIKEKKKAGPRGSPGPKPTGSVKVKTAAGRVCYVLEKKQRGYFAVRLSVL